MKYPFARCLLLFSLLLPAGLLSATVPAPRERLLLDFGWKFHLGDEWGQAHSLAKAGTGYGPAGMAFSDVSWREVNLPHDWAVELPFDRRADGSHGFRAVGAAFPENSIGWYRRTFTLPATDAGRRLWLEFDGVFRDCTVFVNGWAVAHQESGYSGFRCDITDVAHCGGSNVVAVRVNATQAEGWFYEGAGIYRHVWLVKTAPLAIAPDGVFVSSSFPGPIPQGPAQIHLQTSLANTAAVAADATVSWEILSPEGKTVGLIQAVARVPGEGGTEVTGAEQVPHPELWSPESPRLYRLITTVTRAGHAVDRIETEFGIRTVGFDAKRGFLLNGRPYVLQGTCNHQDHAGVGSALPDALQYFRIAQLKKMGANAYRTAHNPPTPELLEACDRLGMLVMDENRLVGSDSTHLRWLADLIRRDRNHPSVTIWSLGNEEFSVEKAPAGGRVLATMQDLVKNLDPTRPVTCNEDVGNVYTGFSPVIEVRGWSYHIGEDTMDAYHAAHPLQPNVGSEQGSTVGTRGIYAADPVRGYVSAYDDNAQPWSNTAEQWVSFFGPRPWLSGGFVWTGFDYRGEPTPYGWPCINSHFGILDTCGFPKDNFWYYQSWWTPQPVLHLLPHWNWAGREGQPIDVRALSNCDEVELFLNGRSLGRQKMARYGSLKWTVPYAPGTLSAKGYQAGRLVAETKVETTGAAAAIRLVPDRATIRADGEDLSVITVAVTDAAGRTVPVAGNHVDFTLEGPGRIIGVGNGDPSCHEPDVYFSARPLHAVEIGGWRWSLVKDIRAKDLPEVAADFDATAWKQIDAGQATGPLASQQQGIFRAHFTLTPAELASPGIELRFGRIEGDSFVYLNGRKIGPGGGSNAPTILDAKAGLHAGDNTVAVAIANYGDAAGVNEGVQLRLIGDSPPVAWSRSVFNGLAQIIVQSAKTAGTLRLTARAEGLAPATIELHTQPVPLRPQVP